MKYWFRFADVARDASPGLISWGEGRFLPNSVYRSPKSKFVWTTSNYSGGEQGYRAQKPAALNID